MRRRLLLAMVVVASMLVPMESTGAQAQSEMEISDSCVAVGQRITQLTVWGSGWGAYIGPGRSLTLEWSYGGNSPPATVRPPTQAAGASFALVFDVTGVTSGFSTFSLIYRTTQSPSPTLVGWENLEIQRTCPSGQVICTSEAGKAVLAVEVQGYDPTWNHQLFYQFRRTGQVGPVIGVVGSDGIARGQFKGLSQVTGATVTARVIEPPGSDSSAVNHYVTFPAPICNDPPPTTVTTAPSTTTTTTAPDDTVPDETTTTRPPVTIPGTPVTVPPTIDLPPPTPGATLSVTPELGPAGFVTAAVGTGFPPGSAVTLTWSPGIGTSSAVVASDGTFTARILVFPNDRLGPRALVASGPLTTAFDAFLVLQSSVQPSGQNVAQITRFRRFNQR